MHMADALVAPIVAGTMYACSTAVGGYSIHKVNMEQEMKKIPVMGVMGAFVFSAQMINFTIPGTGASGHLCGGFLLSAILGPYAGFLTMIGILLIQCLLFADGGLLALGCNIWNMAFYGCFIGSFFVWKAIMRNGITKNKIKLASIVGCIITLQLGAFSVTLETLASGVTELPFSIFVATMQPIHLVIGLVEGLVTAAVLSFIYEVRPEIVWTGGAAVGADLEKNKLSRKSLLVIIAMLAIACAGVLSIFASSNPDGLEWSIEKITGETELDSPDNGEVHQITDKIQNNTAVMPDYTWKDRESKVGGSVAGIIGGVVVVAVCVATSYLIRGIRKKKNKKNEEHSR